jgi:hypothetical protein
VGSVSAVTFPPLIWYDNLSYASLIASTSLALITSILVLDGGLQCFCCRSKPIFTSLRFFGPDSFDYISDKALIKLFSIFSQIGILMALVTVVTESMTFADTEVAWLTGCLHSSPLIQCLGIEETSG